MSIALTAKVEALEKRVAELESQLIATRPVDLYADHTLLARIEKIEQWLSERNTPANPQGRRNG